MTSTRTLRMRDIESLENTSIAAVAWGPDVIAQPRTLQIPHTYCCNTACPTYWPCRITL
jgi:hypothetical protein